MSKQEAHHNMEIKASRRKNSRRINQSFDNTIIFRSACVIQILCLLARESLQQNMHEEKIMKREIEDTTHNGKQEGRQIETDRNDIQMQTKIG